MFLLCFSDGLCLGLMAYSSVSMCGTSDAESSVRDRAATADLAVQEQAVASEAPSTSCSIGSSG
ncbi:hypothetical protein A6R68_05385, partial [Neotoma lepida]